MSEPTPTPGGQSELRNALASDSRRKRNIFIAIAAVVVAAIAIVIGVFAFGQGKNTTDAAAGDAAANGEALSVRIATAEDNPYYDVIAEVAAEKGLEVEWVNVNDWVLPNTELVAGSVDANSFQHLQYLSLFNTEENADLVPAFSTVILQWGIFSSAYTSLDELPDGARIAIPDDLSNGARALFVLEAAGLIEVDDAAGLAPTIDDVTSNPKNIEFVELAGLAITQQYDDPSISAVVIGTGYFDPAAGITKDDALFLDDPLADENLPYVNIITVRADNADNPAWKILEEAYADPRVAEALEKETFGNQVLVQLDSKKLTNTLAELEAFALQSK